VKHRWPADHVVYNYHVTLAHECLTPRHAHCTLGGKRGYAAHRSSSQVAMVESTLAGTSVTNGRLCGHTGDLARPCWTKGSGLGGSHGRSVSSAGTSGTQTKSNVAASRAAFNTISRGRPALAYLRTHCVEVRLIERCLTERVQLQHSTRHVTANAKQPDIQVSGHQVPVAY
jgi:hypothetical protein